METAEWSGAESRFLRREVSKVMASNGNLLRAIWQTDPRWQGINRPYTAGDVTRLRGTMRIEYTLARYGAERMWKLLSSEPYVAALGAVTPNQAIEQVAAGLKAIYVSGWQVAADANGAGQMYPNQSLYPADSVPGLCRSINNALQRADQIDLAEARRDTYWFAPLVADAEAGFGGPLNTFELMKAMIESGAAAVHFEDQVPSPNKRGQTGGKTIVPTSEFISKLVAARLAADVMGVPTIIIARTDASGAKLIRSDVDERDKPFLTGERTPEGDYGFRSGLQAAITRGLAYAPYADMLWCESSSPDLEEARKFAEAIHAKFPGKMLAYNCSPSFNWRAKLDDAGLVNFQNKLAAMGYKFQFVTLAGFHALNMSMFELARDYRRAGMAAYSELQEREIEAAREDGFRAIRHQRFVGAGYFDDVAQVIAGAKPSTALVKSSVVEAQFVSQKAEGPVEETRPPMAKAAQV
jgi:isocitrate/methylisocitrate lyase